MKRIAKGELAALAAEGNLHLEDEDLAGLHAVANDVVDMISSAEHLLRDEYPVYDNVRWGGRHPMAGEDPLNAVVRWCDVEPTGDGPLSGRTLTVKDSIAVAGVPLTLGFAPLGGHRPAHDSVVVERALRAGARIVAVTNMDCFGFAASGETSTYGPTLNPHDASRTAGGSSSGAAASLAYPGIDMALGGDQGGSIRIPAAWCGVLGLKPTHSLVPYTGIGGIDQAIDHAGPLATNAEDLAALLQAIAGPDRSDPRQYDVDTRDYVAAVQSAGDRLDGVRVGILAEGFSPDAGVQDGTARAVRESAERLAALGATLVDVSVPEHLVAGSTGFVINLEGMAALIRGGGTGYGFLGRYSPDFSRALGSALARGADELSLQAKTAWIVGSYLSRRYHAALYAAAQNDVPRVRAAYDRVLADVDMLLLPTAPFPAFEPATDGDARAFVQRGWANLSNTSPFNMTGHPAISLPMGTDGGLPVGTMLVGRHFDDDRLLSVARTYEMAEGWQPLPVVPDAGLRTDRTPAADAAARS